MHFGWLNLSKDTTKEKQPVVHSRNTNLEILIWKILMKTFVSNLSSISKDKLGLMFYMITRQNCLWGNIQLSNWVQVARLISFGCTLH